MKAKETPRDEVYLERNLWIFHCEFQGAGYGILGGGREMESWIGLRDLQKKKNVKMNGRNKPAIIFCCPDSLLTILLPSLPILSNRVPIQWRWKSPLNR